MQNQYDLRKYAVLYVDDEEKALKYFEKTFSDEFRILTASSAADGLRLIEEQGEQIGVLLSDQRMPGEKGVQFLDRVRQLRPRIVRMMVTAYADYSATVDAVNLGNIFRYISKPIQVEDVRNTLHRAMEFFVLQQERDDLLKEKLSTLQNVLISDRVMALGVVAGTLASHLRDPLRGLQGFLSMIPNGGSRPEIDLDRLRQGTFWRDFHGHVAQQSNRIADLLAETLSATAEGTISTAGEAIAAAVAQARSTFTAKGISLDHAPSLPQAPVNKAAFEKMLGLVLDAEAGLLPSGASVTINASVSDTGTLTVSISDTSPGIPPNAVRAVFDPLLTQNAPGTDAPGLGLLGAALLASHQGGSASVPRGSSTFRLNIDLPASPASGPAAAQSSRDFVTNVLMNDLLWERLLQNI